MNMKIKLKTLLASLVIATSFFASVSANAADLERSSSLSFNNTGTAHIGNTFLGGQNLTFQDQYSFSTAGFSDLTSAVISVSFANIFDLNITSFNLYSDVVGSSSPVATGIRHSTGIVDVWSISAVNLTSLNNPYWLQVQGTVMGGAGGSYGGNVNLVTAVPEPETYAMMLAGLGLLGAVARRRKAKQA
jgi:PEP-CTERM motif